MPRCLIGVQARPRAPPNWSAATTGGGLSILPPGLLDGLNHVFHREQGPAPAVWRPQGRRPGPVAGDHPCSVGGATAVPIAPCAVLRDVWLHLCSAASWPGQQGRPGRGEPGVHGSGRANRAADLRCRPVGGGRPFGGPLPRARLRDASVIPSTGGTGGMPLTCACRPDADLQTPLGRVVEGSLAGPAAAIESASSRSVVHPLDRRHGRDAEAP